MKGSFSPRTLVDTHIQIYDTADKEPVSRWRRAMKVIDELQDYCGITPDEKRLHPRYKVPIEERAYPHGGTKTDGLKIPERVVHKKILELYGKVERTRLVESILRCLKIPKNQWDIEHPYNTAS